MSDPTESDDDVPCDRRGAYLVVDNTNVAVHETENYMLGVVVLLDKEWVLVVPPKPTRDMKRVAEEYDFEYPPKGLDTSEILSELASIQEEVDCIQRRLYDLGDISARIDRIKKQLK